MDSWKRCNCYISVTHFLNFSKMYTKWDNLYVDGAKINIYSIIKILNTALKIVYDFKIWHHVFYIASPRSRQHTQCLNGFAIFNFLFNNLNELNSFFVWELESRRMRIQPAVELNTELLRYQSFPYNTFCISRFDFLNLMDFSQSWIILEHFNPLQNVATFICHIVKRIFWV